MKTSTERENKYATSAPEIQKLYADPSSGKILWETYNKYSLPEDKYTQFAVAVGDIILGFYPKTQLTEILVSEAKIPHNHLEKIAVDLADFLAPVSENPTVEKTQPSDSVPSANPELKERLHLRPIGASGAVPEPSVEEPEKENAQPLTRNELMNSLSAKRTMASDIEAVKEHDEKSGDGTPSPEQRIPGFSKPFIKKES